MVVVVVVAGKRLIAPQVYDENEARWFVSSAWRRSPHPDPGLVTCIMPYGSCVLTAIFTCMIIFPDCRTGSSMSRIRMHRSSQLQLGESHVLLKVPADCEWADDMQVRKLNR